MGQVLAPFSSWEERGGVYGYNTERKPLSRRKQAMVCMVMDMSEVKLAVGSLFCGHSFAVTLFCVRVGGAGSVCIEL